MSAPVVSVVIPTWNRAALLPQAVASVLGQTFADLEVLVVDDGSTDGTDAYLAAPGDSRVRSIRLPHCGNVGRVRNAGVAAARGRFLAFLDSDDLWLPEKLARQLEALGGRSDAWCYTAYAHVDEAGRRIPPRAGLWREPAGRIARAVVEMKAAVCLGTVLLPRPILQRLGGFDERPGIREDHELLVRLAVAADAVPVNELLLLVRDHAGRTTRAERGAEPFLRTARTYERMLETLETPELRRAARRRRAEHLAEAGSAHLSAGGGRDAAGLFVAAAREGAPPLVWLSALRRGLGIDRRLARRLLRPLLGRESRAWRLVPSPRLRYRCFGDPVDCVLHALLVSRPRVRFLQVGSNDGRTNDPLWTFRRWESWSGVLVEPVEHVFRRLVRNYAPWAHRFAFEPVAVAAASGTRPFHHVRDSPAAGREQDQIGSLHESLARRPGVPGAAAMVTTEVSCVTLAELAEAHGMRAPDVLHIDAEGADDEILAQVPLDDGPDILLYEHVHMSPSERAWHRDRLVTAGYGVLELEGDTLAVSGSALARLPWVEAAWRVVGGEEEAGARSRGAGWRGTSS